MAIVPIRTIETVYGKGILAISAQTGRPETSGRFGILATQRGVHLPPSSQVADDSPLPAYVDGGRWVVACPDCGNLTLASDTDQLTICAECFNMRAGGKWRRVAFPENRAAIEQALDTEIPARRHWKVGDPVPQAT